MSPADIRRLRALINLAGKLADAIGDAEMRGIVGEWHGKPGAGLKDTLNEFHDWHCTKLGEAEEAA